jgi:hypothetical protein
MISNDRQRELIRVYLLMTATGYLFNSVGSRQEEVEVVEMLMDFVEDDEVLDAIGPHTLGTMEKVLFLLDEDPTTHPIAERFREWLRNKISEIFTKAEPELTPEQIAHGIDSIEELVEVLEKAGFKAIPLNPPPFDPNMN